MGSFISVELLPPKRFYLWNVMLTFASVGIPVLLNQSWFQTSIGRGVGGLLAITCVMALGFLVPELVSSGFTPTTDADTTKTKESKKLIFRLAIVLANLDVIFFAINLLCLTKQMPSSKFESRLIAHGLLLVLGQIPVAGAAALLVYQWKNANKPEKDGTD